MARTEILAPERRSPGRDETHAALTLTQRLPRLVLEARRVAATVSHGIHGRRRAPRPARRDRGLGVLGLPLTFAAPLVLSALVALPVIWLILRVTPPRP